jgi:hypothetical protein
MPKTCFVICPIGASGTEIRNSADDLMEYIINPCPALAELDYGKPVRTDMLNEPGRITSQIIKLLVEDADLVIADLSTNNANVYYELNLRHAVGKPAIHMALLGTPLSFDVQDNRTIFYTMHSRTAERARNELAAQIQRVHQPGYRSMNPITETMGIINLERSTDPNQNTLGQILRMLERLNGDIEDVRTGLRTLQARHDSNLLIASTLSNPFVQALRSSSSLQPGAALASEAVSNATVSPRDLTLNIPTLPKDLLTPKG